MKSILVSSLLSFAFLIPTYAKASSTSHSPTKQQWLLQVINDVNSHWKQPATHLPGAHCLVTIFQNREGDIQAEQISSCTGGKVFIFSVEKAIIDSAPFPMAPNPNDFQKKLVMNFRPSK